MHVYVYVNIRNMLFGDNLPDTVDHEKQWHPTMRIVINYPQFSRTFWGLDNLQDTPFCVGSITT